MADAPTQAQLVLQIGDFFHSQNRAIALYLYVSRDRFTQADVQWYNALGARFEHRPSQEILAKLLHDTLQQGPESARPGNLTLISLEIVAITERMRREHDQLERVASASSAPPMEDVPTDNDSFLRRARLKDALSAGGIVLESLKDLIGDAAPAWLKALLIIGREGVDTLTI